MKFMEDGRISYKEIVKGTGSFGSVNKGIMGDSTVAAFKHLKLQNEEASKSFFREFKVLAEVRHRNLVKIISFCLESGHKILVLEFMSRGNLETLLHSKVNSFSFREILNIAIDVIHGLEYIHHDCFQQVVRCDVKQSNILMDEDMTAHIADFGIATMICGSDGITINSRSTLKGSVGYITPEYGAGGKVSRRGDMYSYGVMLLEMVTGKSPTHHMFVGGLTLHKWVSIHFDGEFKEIIDIRMMREIGKYEINQCLVPFILLGLECSKETPNQRPTAKEAAGVLECIRKTLVEV